MALEPIGGLMSVQAQTYVPVKPVEKTEKPDAEYTEASAQEPKAQAVDPALSVVESGKEKGNSDESKDDAASRQAASNEQVKKAVEAFNKRMANSEAIFGIHEETNRLTIKIVDKKTKETIKELPPEKTLDMIAKVWEMAGILVDEKR